MEIDLKQVVSDLNAFQAKAKEEIAQTGAANLETKEAVAKLQTEANRRMDELEAMLKRPGPVAPIVPQVKSFAERLAETDSFQSLKNAYRMNAAGVVKITDRPLFEHKTTITSGTVGSSTPGILVPERVVEMVKPPMRLVRVRSFIPFGTTNNNAVEYPRENVFTNAASPVSEGSSKLESALTFTIAYANVRCISHWIPASNVILADLPMLQSYIETRLLDGLADAEDSELLFGDNTDQHLNGLCTQATAFAGTYSAASDTRIDRLLAALMELAANNYIADGIVVNPVDWLQVLKLKTEDGGTNKGAYLMGGPGSDALARLWQIPVVQTTAMGVGSFLIGQFRGSVQGYDRLESAIAVSTEHASYFIQNLVAIRAEERITIAVYRPAAFRFGAFT